MKAVGHWLYAMGAKNITKAIDGNRSSSLIGPHQGRRESEKEKAAEGRKSDKKK